MRDASLVPGMPAQFALKEASLSSLHACGERHAALRELAVHAAVCGHRNVPELYGHWRWFRKVLVASELLRGGDLDEALSRGTGGLPRPVVNDVGVQVARALAHMHANGVAHCDVKPANTMFCEPMDRRGGNVVKVVDFGLATRFTTSGDGPVAVRANGGTYEYMSPEALLNEPHDPRSADIYSLGVMLYEMATGILPFPVDKEKMDDWRSHLRKRADAQLSWPPWARGSAAFKALVVRMLADDPSDRPSPSEVVGQLQADYPLDIR